MSIDLPKILLESKNIMQAYKLVNLNFDKARYPYQSLIVGFMAAYALNKPKNIIKPNFEDQHLIDIYAHLKEEFKEVEEELKKEKLDYERVISELSDLSAMICGLVAWIMCHKDDVEDEG